MRALAVVSIVALCAGTAVAQERNTKRVEDLNRAAMEDYDLLELESAKKQLNDALALVKKAKLEKSPVAARTHVNLAIVYGAGLGDQDTALLELIAALEIDPAAKIDAAYRSPALQKTFEQAQSTVAGKRGGNPPDPGTPPSESSNGLRHTPVEDAVSGQRIVLSVRVEASLADRVSQVMLRYRPSGSESFTPAPMRSAGGGLYDAEIPDIATQGDSVHYFIEARAATGKVIATSGTVDSPHIVSLAHPVSNRRPDEDAPDSENPLNNPDEDGTHPRKPVPVFGKKTFYVSVMAGAGAGYITGHTEVSFQAVTCCVAVAPFHVLAEVGFWLGRQFTLSVVGRIGFPLGANVNNKATLAPAVLARATYLFGTRGGLYLHGDLGGGYIRHIVKLSATSTQTAGGDTDTFATGPLFVGGGTGYLIPLGGHLRFVIDLNVLVGIPVIKKIGSSARATQPGFAVNGDLSLGVSLAF